MHSVDKWLDGAELEQDEVNRAATMREKTLQIVEELTVELTAMRGAANSYKMYIVELTEENESLEAEKEHLETVVEGKLKRTSTLEKSVLVLTEDNHILATELKRVQVENESWQKTLITVEETASKAYYNLSCEIEDLRAENERLREIPEQLHKEMSERMVEERKIERKLAVRNMLDRIEKCSTQGYPRKVRLDVVEKIAKEMLEGL